MVQLAVEYTAGAHVGRVWVSAHTLFAAHSACYSLSPCFAHFTRLHSPPPPNPHPLPQPRHCQPAVPLPPVLPVSHQAVQVQPGQQEERLLCVTATH